MGVYAAELSPAPREPLYCSRGNHPNRNKAKLMIYLLFVLVLNRKDKAGLLAHAHMRTGQGSSTAL